MSPVRHPVQQGRGHAPGRALRCASILVAGTVLAACGGLLAPGPKASHFYTLDAPTRAPDPQPMPAPVSAAGARPLLIVALPRASAGFDTDRIVYLREEHLLQAYADSQWIDTPAKMIEPLMVSALMHTGAFGAVLPAPSGGDGTWKLESDIVRLQHEVVAARFRFTLRVALIESRTRSVAFTREFDASAPVGAANPAAAVAAANIVVADVLAQVARACADEIAKPR